ncbi:MAG: hypothetical protein JRF55_08950 [Deltaproteobacteria bacterium]|nr:hypothetical protein [Deltaproteobacteria bacterium]
MGAQDDQVGSLVLSHLDQGPAGRRMLNDAELHLRDPFEKLGGLAGEGLANCFFNLDPNAPLEEVRTRPDDRWDVRRWVKYVSDEHTRVEHLGVKGCGPKRLVRDVGEVRADENRLWLVHGYPLAYQASCQATNTAFGLEA